jgi:hypothetical protein
VASFWLQTIENNGAGDGTRTRDVQLGKLRGTLVSIIWRVQVLVWRVPKRLKSGVIPQAPS